MQSNASSVSSSAEPMLHFLDLPDDVCKARLRARNESGTHPFTTSEAQYDAITAYFVAPRDDERFEIVRHA